jgi:hypothetical protein
MRNKLRELKNFLKIKAKKSLSLTFAYLYRFGLRFDKAHTAYPFIDINDTLLSIPGFTVPNERKYMILYSKFLYSNKGHVCELGCTFGSLTASLAYGMRSKNNKPICSYDLFSWHSSFGSILDQTEFRNTLKDGDSFLHIFQNYTSNYKSLVSACKEDINVVLWDNKKKIEFLLVDAMKSEFLADSILKKFYINLDLESIVFHQDFCHFHEPWIHLIHYKFREYFKFVCHIEDSSSAVFKLTKKINIELVKNGFSMKEFSVEDIHKSFDYSASFIKEEPAKQNILSSKVYCFLACHFFDEAEDELKKLVSNYNFIEEGNLEFVIKLVNISLKERGLILNEMQQNGNNLLTNLDYVTKASQG